MESLCHRKCYLRQDTLNHLHKEVAISNLSVRQADLLPPTNEWFPSSSLSSKTQSRLQPEVLMVINEILGKRTENAPPPLSFLFIRW